MERKLKKCGYARVSTLAEEQDHSIVSQTAHFKWLIENDPAAEFVGIYADKKSGKDSRSRPQLTAMLRAARRGEIDYIVTKSVSRFARNLVETLEIVRELRSIGVGIYFEKDGIDTLDPKSDFLLSILSTIAEGELTSMSENVKWAARNRAQNGEIELTRVYGYIYKDKQLYIEPTEAAVVRGIYLRYANGEGQQRIAKSLTARGIKRKITDTPWRSNTIALILRNEKYTGCCITQKTYKEGFKTKVNNGELPQYLIENSHEAIITQELWDRVQERLTAVKAKQKRSPFALTPFSGKLRCRECGKNYIRRKNNRGTPYEKWQWVDQTYLQQGREHCKGHSIREKDLHALFLSAYNEAAEFISDTDEVGNLSQSIQALLAQERELIALNAKGYIKRDAFEASQAEIIKQIKETEQALILVTKRTGGCKIEPTGEYSDSIVGSLAVAEIDGYTLNFTFKNGATVQRAFDNHADRKATWDRKRAVNSFTNCKGEDSASDTARQRGEQLGRAK